MAMAVAAMAGSKLPLPLCFAEANRTFVKISDRVTNDFTLRFVKPFGRQL